MLINVYIISQLHTIYLNGNLQVPVAIWLHIIYLKVTFIYITLQLHTAPTELGIVLVCMYLFIFSRFSLALRFEHLYTNSTDWMCSRHAQKQISNYSTSQSSTSSVHLPPNRSKNPSTPLFSMLCVFLEFPISVLYHPVHELLSRLFLSFLPSFLPLSPSVESCLLECVQSSSSALF